MHGPIADHFSASARWLADMTALIAANDWDRPGLQASRAKRSLSSMPKPVRSALGKLGAAVAQRRRTGVPRPPKTRQELYEDAKLWDITGRSKMSRAELAHAVGEQ